MVQAHRMNKIIIITGPTASGKTELSIKLAHKLNGEIISCDSMQVYKGLNIGTGKVSEKTRAEIRHYMIDIIPPNEEFSVAQFVKMCEPIIDDIISRNKAPIIVGGTGLYLSGLLFGYNCGNSEKSIEIRLKYEKLLQEHGKDYLFSILRNIDPKSSKSISINDTKRIIRAIEIFELTGQPKSSIIEKKQSSKYRYKMFVLSPERQHLYANIDKRVDKMISDGLTEEVKSLYRYRNCQSMQAIGYKELIDYLDGNTTLEIATDLIKINSRHYAKRQLTYFKHMKADKKFIENYLPNDDDGIIIDAETFYTEDL